jgi:hypothetical protein
LLVLLRNDADRLRADCPHVSACLAIVEAQTFIVWVELGPFKPELSPSRQPVNASKVMIRVANG